MPNCPVPTAYTTISGQEARDRKHELLEAYERGHQVEHQGQRWWVVKYKHEAHGLKMAGGYWEWWSFDLERTVEV